MKLTYFNMSIIKSTFKFKNPKLALDFLNDVVNVSLRNFLLGSQGVLKLACCLINFDTEQISIMGSGIAILLNKTRKIRMRVIIDVMLGKPRLELVCIPCGNIVFLEYLALCGWKERSLG
jgi:hypothetical protein